MHADMKTVAIQSEVNYLNKVSLTTPDKDNFG